MMKKVITRMLAFAAVLLCGGAWADQTLSWQDTTNGCTSETTVFRGITLKELMTKEVAAQMGGKQGTYIGTNGSVPFHALPVDAPNKSGEYIVQFQIIDGNYLKWANVKFVEAIDNDEPVIKATQLANDSNTYNTGYSDNNSAHAHERIGSWMGKGETYASDSQNPANYLLTKLYVVPQLTATITADVTDWSSISWDNDAEWPEDGCAEAVLTVAEGKSFTVNATSALKIFAVNVVGGGKITLGANVQAMIAKASDQGSLVVNNNDNAKIVRACDAGTVTVTPTLARRIEVDKGGVYEIGEPTGDKIYENMYLYLNGGMIANNGNYGTGTGKVQFQNMKFLADSEIGGSQLFCFIAGSWNKQNLNLNGHKLTKTGSNEYIMRTPNFVGGGTLDVVDGTLKLYDPHVDAAGDTVKAVVRSGKKLMLGSANSKGGPSFTGSFDIENYGSVTRESWTGSVAVRNLKNAGTLEGAFTVKGLYEEAGTPIYTGTLTVTPTTTFRFPAESTSMTITCGTLTLAEGMATTINSVQAYVGDESKLVNLTYDTTNKSVSYAVVREPSEVYYVHTTNGGAYTFALKSDGTATKLIDGDTVIVDSATGHFTQNMWGGGLNLIPLAGNKVKVNREMDLGGTGGIPAGQNIEINYGEVVGNQKKGVYLYNGIGDGATVFGSGALYFGYGPNQTKVPSHLGNNVTISCTAGFADSGRTAIIEGKVTITGPIITNSGSSFKLSLDGSLKVPAGTDIGTISSNVSGHSVVSYTEEGMTTYYLVSDSFAAIIGADVYASLADAIAAATAGQTVTLLKGVDGDLSVREGVTVDAGSYEISGKIIIAANAQVTISGTQTTHGVSGSGKLVKNGTGEVKAGRDSSNNTISGVTVEVNGGALWLGHSDSSVGAGASLQNCTFVLNGGTLKGYGWPAISGVTFECRQNATIFSGTNTGHSINGGSFTKTGSGSLTIDAHLRGSLQVAIDSGSFTVSSNRTIESSVKFSRVVLGSSDTVTAPNAVVISGTVSGSGTFNADLTFNAGSTINATNGTVSLAAGKSLTFPEGDLNLVGVGNGDTVIRNVTSTPNGLSTAIVKIGGEAVGHLEYDAANHKVIYSTNTVVEVTPNITDGANLDSNRNFIWKSGAIWKKGDDVVELPEGARIVFDAAEIAGVVISGQTEAGEIYVTNSDTANHPFVFHNHTKEVDGTHEIDDKIDCLTATSINVETFNGELGLRVPIKGDIMFGPSTTLKFVAGADKNKPSKAYAYSITGRAAAIQVALDTDAEAGWFVVPESMYTKCQFAPQDAAVTLVYDVAAGETSTTSPISNNQGSIAKTGAGTLALTSNISQNVKVIVEEGTLKLNTLGDYEMKGNLIVREHAKIVSMKTDAIGIDTDNVRVDIYGTLDMNGTRWTLNRDHANDIYFYPGSSIEGLGEGTNGALDNATANKTNLHFVKNGDQGGTVTFDTEIRFRAANGYNAGMEIVEGMTVDYVNAVGFRTGSGTLNLTGGGVFNIAAAASINNLNKIKLGLGMTLKVAARKTVAVEPIDPTTTVIVETVNQDESKTYVASPVVAKIIVDETTTKLFASVDTALAEATVDQVVTICANILGDLTVPEDKKADAGSYTIGGAIEIGANATLTVSGDRTTQGIAGPGTFIVTSGTITATNKSNGHAVDGATVQIDGGTFKVSLADGRGDGSINNATFVIGTSGTLTNFGYVNLAGTITFDTAADKSVFLMDKGYRGKPAIVKSGSGTLTFTLHEKGSGFSSLTLNGGVFKAKSTYIIEKLISGDPNKHVESTTNEGITTYSLVDVTPLKPGVDTESQDTEPTAGELAKYTPVPVNDTAAAAGQAAILKVVKKQLENGKWVITVDLDETKMPEGKKVDDSAVAFAIAGLDQIAGSTTTQQISVPAGKVTPGAYYSIIYGDTPTALSSEGDRSLATSEGVTITVPAMSGKKVQFFRVKASAYPTAN